MNNFNSLLFVLIPLLITGCRSEKHEFPMDKRYWDTDDYRTVSLELNYNYEDDEKLPSFDDPKTRMIVEKLTNPENYKVVLDDEELGMKHRSGVAQEFFRQWKDMQDIYTGRDLQDKFLYDKELLAVWQFGLGLQLRYFKLGNDNILASADDPDSRSARYRVNDNVSTLIGNFNLYLDEINDENAFTEEGKILLADGIEKYFKELVELYPDADFGKLEKKATLMQEKSNSDDIKKSLKELLQLINSKKPVKQEQ